MIFGLPPYRRTCRPRGRSPCRPGAAFRCRAGRESVRAAGCASRCSGGGGGGSGSSTGGGGGRPTVFRHDDPAFRLRRARGFRFGRRARPRPRRRSAPRLGGFAFARRRLERALDDRYGRLLREQAACRERREARPPRAARPIAREIARASRRPHGQRHAPSGTATAMASGTAALGLRNLDARNRQSSQKLHVSGPPAWFRSPPANRGGLICEKSWERA